MARRRPTKLPKTIFIIIRDGEVSHNVLRTDVFRILKERAKLVLFVPSFKREYFEKKFASPEVIIETIPSPGSPRLETWFSRIFLYSLHSPSIKIKIEYAYRSGGTLAAYLIKKMLWYSGRFYPVRWWWRIFYRMLPDHSFDPYFKKYRSDLVFAANLVSDEDHRLLKTAKRFGIQSIGMPKGWDNLTLKTFLGVFPDWLLVQTPLIKKDAVTFLDYPEERIIVVGFPKFDIYANRSLATARDEFLRKFGLDPQKKTILYAGAGDQLAPHDEEILAEFLKAIERGKVAVPVQVIVRPHPKYRYRKEALPLKGFWVFDRPGKIVGSNEAHVEFEEEDVLHLMNSLLHSDLLVHTASTLGIEAAIFDKPPITIAFDGFTLLDNSTLTGLKKIDTALSVARYYEYVHYKRVIATGGMRVARSLEELINFTNEYLLYPERDREKRKIMAKENAYRIDGKAGERVASFILTKLEPISQISPNRVL